MANLSPEDLAEILRRKAAEHATRNPAPASSGPYPESRAELKAVLENIQKQGDQEPIRHVVEGGSETAHSLNTLPKKHPLRAEVASRMKRARRSGYEGGKASAHVELGATTAKLTRLEAELTVANEALTKEKERSTAQILEIQSRLNQSIEKGSFDTERARQLGDELAAARATAAQQEGDLNARIFALSQDHEKAVTQMRKEVTQHASRVRALESELQKTRAQGAEGSAAQEALRKELKRLTSEGQTAAERLAESAHEIKRLRQTHHGASAELRDMAEALARLGQETRSTADFEAALAQHRTAQEDQAARIGRLEATIAGREERIKELEDAIAGARNEEEKRIGEYHHGIKRRDALIVKWGDVSETLDEIESIFQNTNVLEHLEARQSLLRLIADYRPRITQLLKSPQSVFQLPDPDEMLFEVRATKNDLETLMNTRPDAPTTEREEFSLGAEIPPTSETSPQSVAGEAVSEEPSSSVAADEESRASSEENPHKAPLERLLGRWLRRS